MSPVRTTPAPGTRSAKPEPKTAATKPAAAKPAAAKPVAAKPVAAKPAATKPVAAKPVAAKPAAPTPAPKAGTATAETAKAEATAETAKSGALKSGAAKLGTAEGVPAKGVAANGGAAKGAAVKGAAAKGGAAKGGAAKGGAAKGGASVPRGRVAFVGAGPGDPALLTARAGELLASADVVVADPGIGAEVLALAPVPADTATGSPAEVAKSLVAASKGGRTVVRLVIGDPFTADAVVREALAVSRSSAALEVVPGVPVAVGAAAYAGLPVGQVRTVADVRGARFDTLDWHGLAGAPGTLVLTTAAAELGKVAAGLLEHDLPGDTAVCATAAGTLAAQRSVVTTLDRLEDDAAGLSGDLTLVVGSAVDARERLSWWESRALYGWRVLVPRTKEQAGSMSALLRGYGAVPVEVPTIAVEPPRTPLGMERALKGLVTGRYEWIVFTSTNAVKAVREKFEEFGLDARAFAGVKIACVGDATARAVEDFGIRPELVPSGEQSSEGLLAEFPPFDEVLDPIDRVFLPRADIATDALVAGLKERGWAVDDVTAYRTVRAAPPAADIREAIKSGGFDAVLFTSSSTVRNLVGIAGKPHARTVVACIGPQTCAAATELGLRVDVTPDTANVPALVEALAAYADERRASEPEAQSVPPQDKDKKARSRAR